MNFGDIYFNIENENYKEAEPKMKEVLKAWRRKIRRKILLKRIKAVLG